MKNALTPPVGSMPLAAEGPSTDQMRSVAGTPVPSTAISMWFDGKDIVIAFGKDSHWVRVPIEKCSIISGEFMARWYGDKYGHTRKYLYEQGAGSTPVGQQRGWAVILDILKERHNTASALQTIATQSAPIAYMVEQFLKSGGSVKQCSKKKADENISLEDLGL